MLSLVVDELGVQVACVLRCVAVCYSVFCSVCCSVVQCAFCRIWRSVGGARLRKQLQFQCTHTHTHTRTHTHTYTRTHTWRARTHTHANIGTWHNNCEVCHMQRAVPVTSGNSELANIDMLHSWDLCCAI